MPDARMLRDLLTPGVTYELVRGDGTRPALGYAFTNIERVGTEDLQVQRWLLLPGYKAPPQRHDVVLQLPNTDPSWAGITTAGRFVDKVRETLKQLVEDDPTTAADARYVKANCKAFEQLSTGLALPKPPSSSSVGKSQGDVKIFKLEIDNVPIGYTWTKWIEDEKESLEHWVLLDSYRPPQGGGAVVWNGIDSSEQFIALLKGEWLSSQTFHTYFVAGCRYYTGVPDGEPTG